MLTSNRPRGMVGLTVILSGNGFLAPLRSLRRRATTASPTAQYNLYAHTLGITRLPVPPGGYLPGITSSTIPPDGDKLPAPPRQNGSKEGWNISRRACNVRDIFKAIAEGFCGL